MDNYSSFFDQVMMFLISQVFSTRYGEGAMDRYGDPKPDRV
jgi:hypothetical protein